jgi:PilZ domain-containing protein
MGVEGTRNSFRAAVLGGERKPLVVTDKNPQFEGQGDELDGVRIPRSETRRGDHRGGDRHRLDAEMQSAVYEGATHPVEVVNLSRGGAMIRCSFAPKLWDLIELKLGDGPGLEAAVRWIKGDSIGLEFAHETKLDCSPEERAALLLEVIQRSFPDEIRLAEPEVADVEEEREEEDLGARDEKRHPLIWKGEIHFAHDSNPVRLRNVSAGGALVDVAADYPLGAEVLLDLGNAGQYFAIVQWSCGDEVGLRFVRPFDLACLANARPEVTPHSWTVPTFLNRDENEDSAWHVKWARSSIAEIRSELEGYLKR